MECVQTYKTLPLRVHIYTQRNIPFIIHESLMMGLLFVVFFLLHNYKIMAYYIPPCLFMYILHQHFCFKTFFAPLEGRKKDKKFVIVTRYLFFVVVEGGIIRRHFPAD
jgi:hypothetical protein